MFNFLKICGIGVLAVLLSPLWISFFALMLIYLFFAFIFMSIRVLYLDIKNFFVKDKDDIVDPLGDLPEDYEVRRILEAREKADVELIINETKNETPIETTPIEERKEEVITIEEKTDEEIDDTRKIELNTSLDIEDNGGEE